MFVLADSHIDFNLIGYTLKICPYCESQKPFAVYQKRIRDELYTIKILDRVDAHITKCETCGFSIKQNKKEKLEISESWTPAEPIDEIFEEFDTPYRNETLFSNSSIMAILKRISKEKYKFPPKISDKAILFGFVFGVLVGLTSYGLYQFEFIGKKRDAIIHALLFSFLAYIFGMCLKVAIEFYLFKKNSPLLDLHQYCKKYQITPQQLIGSSSQFEREFPKAYRLALKYKDNPIQSSN